MGKVSANLVRISKEAEFIWISFQEMPNQSAREVGNTQKFPLKKYFWFHFFLLCTFSLEGSSLSLTTEKVENTVVTML